jgi:hypothetical protein
MGERAADAIGVGDGGKIAAGPCRQRFCRRLAGRLAIEIRGGSQHRDAVEVQKLRVGAAPEGGQCRIVLLLRRAGLGGAVGDELGPGLHRGRELRSVPPGVGGNGVADGHFWGGCGGPGFIAGSISLRRVAIAQLDVFRQLVGRLQQVFIETVDLAAVAQLGLLSRRRRADRQIAVLQPAGVSRASISFCRPPSIA